LYFVQISRLLFQTIDKIIGLRLSPEEERLGTDYTEHGIGTESDLFVFENRRQDGSVQDTTSQKSVAIRGKRRGVFGFQRTQQFGREVFAQKEGKPTPDITDDMTTITTNGLMNPVFDCGDLSTNPTDSMDPTRFIDNGISTEANSNLIRAPSQTQHLMVIQHNT
jgi:hypothetical protein